MSFLILLSPNTAIGRTLIDILFCGIKWVRKRKGEEKGRKRLGEDLMAPFFFLFEGTLPFVQLITYEICEGKQHAESVSLPPPSLFCSHFILLFFSTSVFSLILADIFQNTLRRRGRSHSERPQRALY